MKNKYLTDFELATLYNKGFTEKRIAEEYGYDRVSYIHKRLKSLEKLGFIDKMKDDSIDHGKIMALHNAGWTHRQIASEMNIDQLIVEKEIENDN
jgi:DNA-binding transcriptional regulator LsrR (DeoR family)